MTNMDSEKHQKNTRKSFVIALEQCKQKFTRLLKTAVTIWINYREWQALVRVAGGVKYRAGTVIGSQRFDTIKLNSLIMTRLVPIKAWLATFNV